MKCAYTASCVNPVAEGAEFCLNHAAIMQDVSGIYRQVQSFDEFCRLSSLPDVEVFRVTRKVDAIKKAQLIAARRKGMQVQAIADEFFISKSLVSRFTKGIGR